MKTNPWFRMYSDFIYDEKIEFLAFEDQRHFVFLLCMKNLGLLDKEYPSEAMRERVIAKRLGLVGEALIGAKTRLLEACLIDEDWQPTAWDKRQFVSDADESHAERQRRYRERQKMKRYGDVTRDVTVTRADTDTDTDTDTEQKEQKQRAPRFDAQAHLVSIGVDASIAADWIHHRKTLKASPTLTAIDGIAKESERAGISLSDALSVCCQRGWRGFKAEWVKPDDQVQGAWKSQRDIERDEVSDVLCGRKRPALTERVITGEVINAS